MVDSHLNRDMLRLIATGKTDREIAEELYTPIADFLQGLGVPEWRAWLLAGSGKGWWRLAGSPQAAEAMSLAWFREQGLTALTARYAQLKQ